MSGVPAGDRWWKAFVWAAAISIVAGALISMHRAPHLWYDEVCSVLLVSDPSVIHLLRSIADGAETSPPLYHLLAHAWGSVFGYEQGSLRAISILGFVFAVPVLFAMLRRYYSVRGAACAVVIGLAGSELVAIYSVQLRFYGVFFCVASVAAYAACRVTMLAERETQSSDARWRVVLGLALAALLYTHMFGLLYAAALSAVVILHEWLTRRTVSKASIAAIAIPWLSFVPWLPAFRTQRALVAGSLWLIPPGPRTVLDAYDFGVRGLPLYVGLLVVAAVIQRAALRSMPQMSSETALPSRLGVRLVGVSFLLVPLGTAVESHVGVAIFLPRYLLPSLIGLVVLLAELCDALLVPGDAQLRVAARRTMIANALAGCACAFALMMPPFYGGRTDRTQRPDLHLTAGIDSSVRALPVVLESQLDYVPIWYYSGRPVQKYAFVMDSAAAVDPRAARGELTQIRYARAWKRAGYSPDMIEAEDFLASHDAFLVVDMPEWRFFERRIRNNPAWRHCTVGAYDRSKVHLVVRSGGTLTGCKTLDD